MAQKNLQTNVNQETEYFIFGEKACETYHVNGVSGLIELLSNPVDIDFKACAFKPGVSASDVIEHACGWLGEAQVDKGDFDEIAKAIPLDKHFGVICHVG